MFDELHISVFFLWFIQSIPSISVTRLEDKESEMKKEYGKLHDRYSELFKTHLDYMERTKSVLGPERMDALQVWSLLLNSRWFVCTSSPIRGDRFPDWLLLQGKSRIYPRKK